ncbi:Hypothetical predicted protein [Podarcis lilfordi]|uniref:Uncharacterized protein n=1 Tax=Podarcis lilfordi TaxID=74358 RepID=A0AA35JNX3_9SAUR|nr:Hypothetical predicted protein [Podarcis lilfordi]
MRSKKILDVRESILNGGTKDDPSGVFGSTATRGSSFNVLAIIGILIPMCLIQPVLIDKPHTEALNFPTRKLGLFMKQGSKGYRVMDLNTRKVRTRHVVHFDEHMKTDMRGTVVNFFDQSEEETQTNTDFLELMYDSPDLPSTATPPSTDAEQEREAEKQIARSSTVRGEEADDEMPVLDGASTQRKTGLSKEQN